MHTTNTGREFAEHVWEKQKLKLTYSSIGLLTRILLLHNNTNLIQIHRNALKIC